MPTTRAARRAARCLTDVLPADALGLVLYQLTLAHDIAAVAPTCRVVCDAAKLAMKLRPFSGEVVTLAGHTGTVRCVAALAGHIITGSNDATLKIWRDGACAYTIQTQTGPIQSMAVLPGGARFVTGSEGGANLWALDGTLERTFEVNGYVFSIAAMPDGVHFVVGITNGEVRLYHVDGTLVHTFKGHVGSVYVAVTPDGQHIISGSDDNLVKVWSVASKSLVSTCEGHAGLVDEEGEHFGAVNAVAAMPDGQRILSGGDDNTVRVWLLDGTLENTFDHLHIEPVMAIVALPDNQHALSAAHDQTVELFNVNDGAVLRTFTGQAIRCNLALMPDGLRFVSGSMHGHARIVEHGLAPQ